MAYVNIDDWYSYQLLEFAISQIRRNCFTDSFLGEQEGIRRLKEQLKILNELVEERFPSYKKENN